MSAPGIGAMIHWLGGGSKESAEKYAGRTITATEMTKLGGDIDGLLISFDDGVKISITDRGQSCCESRYITTDDDIQSIVGGKLVSITAKDGPEASSEWGEPHETCFVEIATSKGAVTLTTHNEHNGYYGGFGLNISEEEV